MSLRKNVKKKEKVEKKTQAELINAEAELGRTIFGPIPEGRRREFFHHQRNVWIWYESWAEKGQKYQNMVRYEVRENGVFKRWNRGDYVRLSEEELENFRKAARTYLRVIKEKLYNEG